MCSDLSHNEPGVNAIHSAGTQVEPLTLPRLPARSLDKVILNMGL